MANFRAVIQGQRGSASRLGSKSSGIQAQVNGWNVGVRVTGQYDPSKGEDIFEVELTGGSNGASRAISLGYFGRKDLERLQAERPAVFS